MLKIPGAELQELKSGLMSADSVERFTLSRQDASVSKNKKTPLDRTDKILSELLEDDDLAAFELPVDNQTMIHTCTGIINNNELHHKKEKESCFAVNNMPFNSFSSISREENYKNDFASKQQRLLSPSMRNSSHLVSTENITTYSNTNSRISTISNIPANMSNASKIIYNTPVRSQFNIQNALLRQQTTLEDVSGKANNGKISSLDDPYDHNECYNQDVLRSNIEKNDRIFFRNGTLNCPPMYNRPSSPRNGETKLQTSLSTPCEPAGQLPSAITIKREAECRRFKSEGSTTNNVHNPSVTLIDPHLDDSSCNYDGRSLNQQGNYYKNPNYPINLEEMPKSSHTEQVMRMHTLKAKMQKYKEFIDAAFGDNAIGKGEDQCIIDGCTIGTKVMKKSWEFQYISQELSHALCEHLCDKKYLEVLIQLFVNTDTTEMVRVCCGRFMQEILTECNRAYIIEHNYLKKIVTSAMMLRNNADQQRISLSIIECLFKDSENTTYKMITYGTIEYIIATCQRALTSSQLVLRQASLAFVNAVLYSSAESRKIIIEKKHHEWLYLLAQQNDEISRYYACLAVCILASFTDTESAALKCDTLGLVDPFLSTHIPIAFANKHFMHSPGRDNVWLRRLLSLLRSRCRQAKGIFGFHFVLETIIKKRQEKTPMFHEIGAIPYLKEIASSPDDQAAQFASDALTYIGEEVPHKLSRDVPCWNVTNVQCWVQKIGFDDYCEAFGTHKVDGDLLLLMTEQELEHDIKITSGLLRKKFMRELESLKIAADYSSVDETQLDQFLMSLSPELSAYTYQMLNSGLNRSLLPHLTDLWMEKVCGIQNIIHRHKLRQALEQGKHFDDIELSALSKQYDIFISYRRSNGNQLASLIKVMLTIQGYRVFIDVDRLHGGEFESSLLKKIQSAKHFLIVLTENSLDRLKDDDACQDWIHKELKCAFEHKKNIVPVMAEEFKFPLATEIPEDIRQIATFNGVNWVHEYQDACIGKIKRFLNEFEDGIPIPKSVSKTITKKEQAAKGKMTATTANTSSTTSPRNTTLKATKKYTSINGSTNGKLTPSNSTNGKLTPSNSTVTRPTRRIYAPNNNEFSLNHKN